MERRARELGIRHVMQGREDKLAALKELLAGRNIPLEQAAYMGDDLPDLAAIQACGLGMVPADGDPYVAGFSDWRSFRPGGRGAAREACEFILEAQGKLKAARADYLE